MPGFHLYRSASTEALADRFVGTVAGPGAPLPLDVDELVVVQGRGMERWLGQRAAAKLGVWAGARFPYPRAAATELAARVLGDHAATGSGNDQLVLALAVAEELPALMRAEAGRRVRAYIGSDRARLLSFAQQAASVLDGYMVHRSELLDRWTAGEAGGVTGLSPADEAWQAELWRAVQRRAAELASSEPQLASMVQFWPRLQRATRALRAGQPCPGVGRLSVFAVASIPPELVQFLVSLGRVVDVHWYAIDPAAETAGSPADLTTALCASDLASVSAVQEAAESAANDGIAVTRTVLPGAAVQRSSSVLARVQALARTANSHQGAGIASDDRSLRVHACPGAVREVEVLHDELLRAFDELPGLAHEDIVVLVPDIAVYAPVIEAVLRGGRCIGARGVEARIPASVADLSDRDGSPIAVALVAALRIADSDMGVRSALELLGQPVVAARFLPPGVAPEACAAWLHDAGARRFLDAEHRGQAGLPETDEGTWDAALDRLFAGLAAADGPSGAVPGTTVFPAQPFLADGAAVGRTSEFARFLRDLRSMARRGGDEGRPIQGWLEDARAILDRIAPAFGEGERESRAICQQLAVVEQAARAAGLTGLLPFAAARTLLCSVLETGRAGRGFLAGGVTVCQFVPMRAVPFRVVCMVGMDDESFPRGVPRPAFDAMALQPRPGDPEPRAADRALFLQSVLGARDRLVITYPAQELATGNSRAASTAVATLLDAAAQVACDAGADGEALNRAREALTVVHPLHAFSVSAFDGCAQAADRVGYDARARVAAERLARGCDADAARPFICSASSVAAPANALLRLEDVAAFFRDPARATLRSWGVSLYTADDAPPEHERVGTDPREGALLYASLLRTSVETGTDVGDADILRLQRDGRLAQGVLGRWQGGAIAAEVQSAMAAAYPGGVVWHDVDVDLGATRVRGRVATSEGVVAMCAPGAISAKHKVECMLWHLAWVASGGASGGFVYGRGGCAPFAMQGTTAVQAIAQLRAIVALRAFGLEHGLPFFAELSLRAATAMRKGASMQDAVDAIRSSWDRESGIGKGIGDAGRVLFRGCDPFAVDLGDVPGACRALFGPVAWCVCAPLVTPGGAR